VSVPEVRPGQRVTGLRRSRRDAALVVVMLDGARTGEVDAAEAERLGVARGMVLDARGAEALGRALAIAAARRDAARLARARPRTKAELVLRLLERGHDRGAAEGAASLLVKSGAVNDLAVAEGTAIGLAERRASRRLARERLERRGIDPDQATAAVERAFGDQDERSRAIDAARRRANALRGLDPATARRRLAGFLARRGYDEETCLDAVRVVLGEQE